MPQRTALSASIPGVYHVSDFGAVGDGVTDDTAALQDALAAAEGATLYFDASSYVVSDLLTVRQGTTLRGRGATIVRKTGYSHEILGNWQHGATWDWADGDTTTTGYNGSGDITIDGITFDGNAGAEPSNIVSFVHCQNIVIRDCVFLDCTADHHLELNSTRHARVSNCQFLGFRPNAGISVRKEAIQIDWAHPSLGMGGARDGTMSADISIEGCYFGPDDRGNRAPNIAVGTHQEASAGSVHENLRVLNCVGTGLNHAGTRWVNTRGLRVVGNEFTLSRRPVPVAYNETDVMLYGFACTVSDDVLVADNRIAVDSGEKAISVDIRGDSSRALIIGNTLAYGRYALFVEDSYDCNFRDNYCLSHTVSAVHLRSAWRAHIAANTFYNAGANGGNIAAVEGSGTAGQASWNTFDSNVAQYIGSSNEPPAVGVACDLTTSRGTAVRMNRFREVTTVHTGPSTDVVAYNTSD
ncbi:MAG: glycosyl hydrolase family 28-related protein [Protaetiibacter sp.]